VIAPFVPKALWLVGLLGLICVWQLFVWRLMALPNIAGDSPSPSAAVAPFVCAVPVSMTIYGLICAAATGITGVSLLFAAIGLMSYVVLNEYRSGLSDGKI
jgi:hypothetical protein